MIYYLALLNVYEKLKQPDGYLRDRRPLFLACRIEFYRSALNFHQTAVGRGKGGGVEMRWRSGVGGGWQVEQEQFPQDSTRTKLYFSSGISQYLSMALMDRTP